VTADAVGSFTHWLSGDELAKAERFHSGFGSLVMQPWQDPTLSQEREILGGFCPADETRLS